MEVATSKKKSPRVTWYETSRVLLIASSVLLQGRLLLKKNCITEKILQ
jgi:hypothetical protein